MKTPTKSSIFKALPTQHRYGVQLTGGKFYAWVGSKREAARIAWAGVSDGWLTRVKGDDLSVIWKG